MYVYTHIHTQVMTNKNSPNYFNKVTCVSLKFFVMLVDSFTFFFSFLLNHFKKIKYGNPPTPLRGAFLHTCHSYKNFGNFSLFIFPSSVKNTHSLIENRA